MSVFVAQALVGCASANQSESADTGADTLSSLELPFPILPENLQGSEEKADFVVTRFWDSMDFSDTIRSHSDAFIEQNFVNFITLFPYASEEGRQKGVKNLLQRAEADSAAFRLVATTADLYLYEPNSPYYSEDYYIIFLKELTDAKHLDVALSERVRWQLESAMKNRPGHIAADFSFTILDGKKHTLSDWNPDAERILLVFYNPDCRECKETLQHLMTDETINRQIAEKKLAILAIDPGYDEELWGKTANSLPATWTVGYESGEIEDKELYVLRAMPSLYLLDREKRVVEKETRR